MKISTILTLKAPITTAADDKFWKILLNFRKNKVWHIIRIVCQQTILMKYHALFVIFEKAAKFEIVVCCKLQAALYRLSSIFFFYGSYLIWPWFVDQHVTFQIPFLSKGLFTKHTFEWLVTGVNSFVHRKMWLPKKTFPALHTNIFGSSLRLPRRSWFFRCTCKTQNLNF